MVDSIVVSVSLLIICESSSEMSCDKADLGIGIIHSDCHSTLISSHTRHSGLLDTTFDILDLSKARRLDENAESSTNKLSTAQKDVMLTPRSSSLPIQCLSNCFLPCLLPCRITVHYLLWAEFDDFLKSNGYDLWLPL